MTCIAQARGDEYPVNKLRNLALSRAKTT